VSDSLFSASWYRVAALKPRLRSHALIHRHLYRGQIWYVLQDRSSGRFHRFSPIANLVIGLMDGERTLAEVWELACTQLGDDVPTQDEVIGMLGALHRADVLRTDVAPDMQELHQRHDKQRSQKLRQYLQNPLSLRFPLFDPDRLLTAMNGVTRHLFGVPGAILWVLSALWAVVTAGQHWNALTRDISDQLLATENLVLIALVFPVAKIVHEFSHAMVIKARGGAVHEMGVMLLVMMPIPYLDASDSLAFRSKADRMLVGAAGMLGELWLAMLALLVWVNVEPGIVRALAYNTMLVAGISTLVFNANPLLRFDGYYIFSDWLEIPNLGQRANAHIGYLVKRYLLRLRHAEPGQDAPGERAWFVFYAIASFIYRISVSISIALVIAKQYFVIGILLALWSVYGSLVLPLGRQVQYLFVSSDLRRRRWQATGTVAGMLAAAVVLICYVPAPSWTRTEGVALASEETALRAESDGLITALAARPSARVKRGQALIYLADPELQGRARVLQAQLDEQLALYAAAVTEPVRLNQIREELAHVQARLDDAHRRIADLVIRSPGDGLFLMADSTDAPGRFVRRGDSLGHVLDYRHLAVQVVVPQSDVDLVRKMTRRVELRLVENIPALLVARVKRVVPAATSELPGEALGARGGGELALDPNANPNAAPAAGAGAQATAASSVFIFELELADPDAAPLRHIGSRIYARFEREPEPLGAQWYRALRRMLLSMFNV
jgi:putative peptide zinc metalloprotease protein